jgi:predicted RNase H-like HicB family nuclease
MMDDLRHIHVGLEEGADGMLMAHALNLPGCAAIGASPEEAMREFERSLVLWLRFLASTGERVPAADDEIQVSVDEWIATDARVGGAVSTVLFEADLAPLRQDEAELGVRRLGDIRGLLLAHVRRRRNLNLDVPAAATSATVRQVLEELARAQWLLLSRLGASPMAGAPDHTLARLDTAAALVVDRMTTLPDDARARRLELDGEEWTPRKVLRRLLGLEWSLGVIALAGLQAAEAENAAP